MKKRLFYHYSLEFEQKYIQQLASQYDLTSEYQRSYCQYLCFKKIDNPTKHIAITIWASVSGAAYLVLFFIKSFFFTIKSSSPTEKPLAVDLTLVDSFNDIVIDEFDISKVSKCRRYLRYSDAKDVLKIFINYWKSPYFVFKAMFSIAEYRYYIDAYAPKAILVNFEFWFTSSLLTLFCERNKIEHINLMHGEKLLWFRDSFFRFHRCYVWDVHYINLFLNLNAEPNQFSVSLSNKFRAIKSLRRMEKVPNLIKYYLQGDEDFSVIQRIGLKVEGSGRLFVCRVHPRYTFDEDIKNVNYIRFESNEDIGFIESLQEASIVMGKYSTVLFEAWLLGVPIVIDDISDVALYKALQERWFIVLSKPYQLLSEFI